MAEDAVSGSLTVDLELEGTVAEWVRREAAARDAEPEELLDELLRAHATVDEDAESVTSLREEIEALDREVDELIEDVRDRVIQVKKETDAKAPADHDHPELREALQAGSPDEVGALRDRLERGFENYEEVLTYLTDQTEELDGKTTRLAGALVNVRDEVHRLAEASESRTATEELAAEANRQGVTEADCESCGESVDIRLLGRPTCPHCAATFTDLVEKSWLFGSATLSTGDRPALESGDDPDDEHDLESLLESATEEPPSPTAGADSGSESTDDSPSEGESGR